MKERQYDLAILRSLGASQTKIVTLIFTEAFILIAAGQILGIMLGHSFLEIIQSDNITLRGFIFVKDVWLLNGFIFILSLIPSMLPAYRAYKIDMAVLLKKWLKNLYYI